MDNERWYDQVHNEGGEGYNPHRGSGETPEPLIWRLIGHRDSLLAIMAGTSMQDRRYVELEADLAATNAAIARERGS